MSLPIKLISTDFDGTIFAESDTPAISMELLGLIARLQARGAKWVINTGRDMVSLQAALARIGQPVRPDFLVLVEREMHAHDGMRFVGINPWNEECQRAHRDLFVRVMPDLPRLTGWIKARFSATVYEDPYSPLCLIAANNGDADLIHEYLEAYCGGVSDLTLVRNDVYARFSHAGYNKGTALEEITRRLGLTAAEVFAAGDHLNDLPMLSRRYAHWLASPHNAVQSVKQAVLSQHGCVSRFPASRGVAEALLLFLRQTGVEL
jgi:hypothetical protein